MAHVAGALRFVPRGYGSAERLIDRPNGDPRELTEAAAQALIMWTGNDDGFAGRRVLKSIYNEILH